MNLKRFILPVIGEIMVPDIIYKISNLPEIQRLRHISLSNVDSCTLAAIGGVSRYEHSLGTAILAWKLSEKLGLDQDFQSELILAAGLHDVAAPGLGHLFEEGCYLADLSFNHEKRLKEIFFEENSPYYQTFLGKELGCRKLMCDLKVSFKSVFDTIAGYDTRCKNAINGSIDLDNIDNVARMLSRLGIAVPLESLLEFLDIFEVKNSKIVLHQVARVSFDEWLLLRKKLYNILMLEPSDFVAKTMTKQAIFLGLRNNIIKEYDWCLTDHEMYQKLINHEITKELIERLLLANYYRLIGLYWIEGKESIDILKNKIKREVLHESINKRIGKGILIDYIPDKRERKIDGSSSDRALVGIISKYATPGKFEQELCEEFIKENFTFIGKASLTGQYLQINKTDDKRQSFLPFMDK
ncbi:MAG: hypothetical protein A2Y10_08755 [Planctomycetes bacterium GWF2_41_51]|nr:MAG: hypothetical protein A2Y10_08755 [Planctomycetes bacterium GWF2_41_51]HBG28355.1 hypothetical protein [Phycisphaerales bacterium]